MRNLLRGLLVAICCMAGIAMADEKNILVTSGSDRATPIAVVPFGWQGGSVLPDDMAEIIGNDLRNSGYYSPIPKQNMISLPTQASEVIYRDWKALGAQYIMVGSIAGVVDEVGVLAAVGGDPQGQVGQVVALGEGAR
ncbi:Tol-Pal system beta propeller repeat protein TolB, partial [Pseudomonas sp. NPDC089530]